jgi:hypothetical protein
MRGGADGCGRLRPAGMAVALEPGVGMRARGKACRLGSRRPVGARLLRAELAVPAPHRARPANPAQQEAGGAVGAQQGLCPALQAPPNLRGVQVAGARCRCAAKRSEAQVGPRRAALQYTLSGPPPCIGPSATGRVSPREPSTCQQQHEGPTEGRTKDEKAASLAPDMQRRKKVRGLV